MNYVLRGFCLLIIIDVLLCSASSIVDIQPEINDALMNNRPVVALESTIITHGMPHPHNLETAIEVESIVREQVIGFVLCPVK